MASSIHRRRAKSLSHGRPANVKAIKENRLHSGKSAKSISSKHTRRLIRSHHTLHKRLAQAVSSNNLKLASSLQTEIDEQGGLAHYQAASINGADRQRGGDTSKKLLEFLNPAIKRLSKFDPAKHNGKPRMLDVGALSVDTAAARSRIFDITRIDLHSRETGILEQDFMARPLPAVGSAMEDDKFDIVCLSLVLNYVPEPKARGDMLQRVCFFLRSCPSVNPGKGASQTTNQNWGGLETPLLFLVLPAPCLTNSRYLDQKRLEDILQSLGFSLLQHSITAKLHYSLWKWHGHSSFGKRQPFSKSVVNPGRTRNNFAIVLDVAAPEISRTETND